MYKITINKPTLAPGTELQINGLGIVKNGETFFVDEEQAQTFRVMNLTVASTTNRKGEMEVKQVLGPTLLQAFKGDKTVKVETADNKGKKDTPETGKPASPPNNTETGEQIPDPAGDDK